MPNISTGINLDSNFLSLKAIEIKEVRPEVEKLLSYFYSYINYFLYIFINTLYL